MKHKTLIILAVALCICCLTHYFICQSSSGNLQNTNNSPESNSENSAIPAQRNSDYYYEIKDTITEIEKDTANSPLPLLEISHFPEHGKTDILDETLEELDQFYEKDIATGFGPL